MVSIIESIIAIKADVQVTVSAEDVNQITWHDSNPTNITNAQILSKQAELQIVYDANQYQRDREFKYPTWQDQMDMQYHDLVNDTTTWKDAVEAVKDAYPKP